MYQTKNTRMIAYRNAVWDLIDNFFHAFNIFVVPREESYLFGHDLVFPVIDPIQPP